MKRTFNVVIEQDENGMYIVKVIDMQGCYTQGKTIEEAIERVKEAIQVCLESEQEDVPEMKFIGIQRIEVKV
jgi:predicted RNase H-like HicB family nuclease